MNKRKPITFVGNPAELYPLYNDIFEALRHLFYEERREWHGLLTINKYRLVHLAAQAVMEEVRQHHDKSGPTAELKPLRIQNHDLGVEVKEKEDELQRLRPLVSRVEALETDKAGDLDTIRNFLGDVSIEMPIGRVIRRVQDLETANAEMLNDCRRARARIIELKSHGKLSFTAQRAYNDISLIIGKHGKKEPTR